MKKSTKVLLWSLGISTFLSLVCFGISIGIGIHELPKLGKECWDEWEDSGYFEMEEGSIIINGVDPDELDEDVTVDLPFLHVDVDQETGDIVVDMPGLHIRTNDDGDTSVAFGNEEPAELTDESDETDTSTETTQIAETTVAAE
ncbi:MAG TPA: hypothetical protein PKV44_01660 [Bacillota bacterium]|nr:hypothetical protein [Bacillota bacterium]HPE38415.1 hypothetical protein [Bacillota bacterium]